MALKIMPPNAIFPRATWVPPAQNQVNRSGWTGAQKIVRLPGAGRWRVSASLMEITTEAAALPWYAFFTSLEGRAHSFLMPWKRCQPVAADAIVGSAGAAAGAETALIAGMPASRTYLAAGRVLTFVLPSGVRQMVMLTQNLVANSSGVGTATFRAPLRQALAPGAIVLAKNPVCQMKLTQDDVPLPEDEGKYNFAFDAEESFEA